MPFGPAQLLLSPRRSMALVSGVPFGVMFSDVLFRDGRPDWSKHAGTFEARGILGFHRWFPYGLPEVKQCVYFMAIASPVC